MTDPLQTLAWLQLKLFTIWAVDGNLVIGLSNKYRRLGFNQVKGCHCTLWTGLASIFWGASDAFSLCSARKGSGRKSKAAGQQWHDCPSQFLTCKSSPCHGTGQTWSPNHCGSALRRFICWRLSCCAPRGNGPHPPLDGGGIGSFELLTCRWYLWTAVIIGYQICDCGAWFFQWQDRIPVDGVVKAGKSTVDESSLTGEPLPVVKQSGVWTLLHLFNRLQVLCLLLWSLFCWARSCKKSSAFYCLWRYHFYIHLVEYC